MDQEPVFWSHGEHLLAAPSVTRSAMDELPSLQYDGAPFAAFNRNSGDLLVRLPAERVNALIASGTGRPFSLQGSSQLDWLAIAPGVEEQWSDYLEEALAYVQDQPKG